jgi:hypothetical protein
MAQQTRRQQKQQQQQKQKQQQKQQKKQQDGKTKRKPSKWNLAVKKVYQDMKKADKNVTFGQALQRASQLKKQGQL